MLQCHVARNHGGQIGKSTENVEEIAGCVQFGRQNSGTLEFAATRYVDECQSEESVDQTLKEHQRHRIGKLFSGFTIFGSGSVTKKKF